MKKYKIYKLVHPIKGIVYIGRTTLELSARKVNRYRGTSVEDIAKECIIELIEETDDTTRERYWITYYKDSIVNIVNGDGFNKKEYEKEYYIKKYKEHRKEYNKQYREDNLEYFRNYMREYYRNKKNNE